MMSDEREQAKIDKYLDRTYGVQTPECSEINLRRAMDFTGFIYNMKLTEMLELFEVSRGKQWCASKWTYWVAGGKQVWWLWTSLDKTGKTVLCDWYMRSIRTI